ncbi:MAG: DUF4115 domain-containing protein [Gammaproteobacteria bacterium]|nr:DUF4115 domain-containing protein [Gammaproteobacteria bacterium]
MINEESMSNETTANELIHQQEFGLQLKQARESRGLTISEISEQLNLSEEVLKALEGSNLEQLPAPTFTQGYIRAYARLLKLSEDGILDAYNMSIPNKENPLVPNYGMPIQPADKMDYIKPLFILLFVGFIMMTAYLLVSMEDASLPEYINQSVLDNVSDVEESSTDTVTEGVYPDIDQEQSDMAQPDQSDMSSDESLPLSGQDELPVDENNTDESVVVPEEEIQQQEVVQPEAKKEVRVEDKSGESLVVKVHPVAPGDDVLNLVTDSASWAEVDDANGQRLIFELLKKGQTYRLKGTAPFNVFLGNAPATRLLINDKEVVINKYIRKNNIASIIVDDKGVVKNGQRDNISFNSNDKNTQANPSAFDD